MGDEKGSYSDREGNIYDVVSNSENIHHENGYTVKYPSVILKNRETGDLQSVLSATLHVFYKKYISAPNNPSTEDIFKLMEKTLTDFDKNNINNDDTFESINETAQVLANQYSTIRGSCNETPLHKDTISFLKGFASHVLFTMFISSNRKESKKKVLK